MHFYGSWPNILLLISILIYFIFDYRDRKHIVDEREELIELKTHQFVHKSNSLMLLLFCIVHFFHPTLNALWILAGLILSSLYLEIIAKFVYRKRL